MPLCACSATSRANACVGEQERLRQVEQRRPQLVLDARAARSRARCTARSAPRATGCASASARNTASSIAGVRSRPRSAIAPSALMSSRVDRERIPGGMRREPALGRLRVGERVLGGLAESEHGVPCRSPPRSAGAAPDAIAGACQSARAARAMRIDHLPANAMPAARNGPTRGTHCAVHAVQAQRRPREGRQAGPARVPVIRGNLCSTG